METARRGLKNDSKAKFNKIKNSPHVYAVQCCVNCPTVRGNTCRGESTIMTINKLDEQCRFFRFYFVVGVGVGQLICWVGLLSKSSALCCVTS